MPHVKNRNVSRRTGLKNLPKQFVLHDSCVMTRDLGIVEEARNIAESMGIRLLEPENNRLGHRLLRRSRGIRLWGSQFPHIDPSHEGACRVR